MHYAAVFHVSCYLFTLAFLKEKIVKKQTGKNYRLYNNPYIAYNAFVCVKCS